MELSENTLNVLRNFSGINQNILIKQGTTLKTISEARNVVATADVAEEFPKDFGVYDLNQFQNFNYAITSRWGQKNRRQKNFKKNEDAQIQMKILKTMHKIYEAVSLKDLKKLTKIYANILDNYFSWKQR